MLAKNSTLALLSALGLLLSTSASHAACSALKPPATNEPLPLVVARSEARLCSDAPGRVKADVGPDALYALFTKGLGAKPMQETITKMVLNEAVTETPAMALLVEEARLAVDRDDQKAAFRAMRLWSAEVDRELGLSR